MSNQLKRIVPLMRRNKSTAIIHSGGKQTVFGCVCGSRHTAATSYRHAKHVVKWRQQHEACSQVLFERWARGETILVHLGEHTAIALKRER